MCWGETGAALTLSGLVFPWLCPGAAAWLSQQTGGVALHEDLKIHED